MTWAGWFRIVLGDRRGWWAVPTLRIYVAFAGFHEDGGGDAAAAGAEGAVGQGDMPAAGRMIGDLHGDLPNARFVREGGHDTPRHRALNAN